MPNKLVKHVLKCTQCDFLEIVEDYNPLTEQKLLASARQHSKETEHSLMLQS